MPKFYHDNGDLGLEDLGPGDPHNPTWPAALFAGYQRLGTSTLNDDAWLAEWKPNNNWYWPEKDGFLLDQTGNPIQTIVELGAGMLLDRFGGNDTAFFAQYGTPYAMRSLAPCIMNMGYRVYMVLKPFEVVAGPARPWFDQPGLCLQFKATHFDRADRMIHDKVLHELNEEERRNLFAGKLSARANLKVANVSTTESVVEYHWQHNVE